MPDDKKEEVAEQIKDDDLPDEVDDALKSFMEDDEDEKLGEGDIPDDDDKAKKKDDDKSDIDKKPDKDKGESEKKEPEKKPDKEPKPDEPIYSEELDKRLKERAEKKDGPEPDPEPEPKKKTKKSPEKKEDPTPTDDFDIALTDDDLTDDLKDYKKDYPDDYEAITTIANIIAKKMVEKQTGNFDDSKFVKSDQFQNVNAKLADILFWNDITEVHSDAKAINKSKDFCDWLDGQDEPLQRLAKNLERPEDAIMVLDYYKAGKAKKKVDEVDLKAKDKKKKVDDLHKGSMRSKSKVKLPAGDVDMEDAEGAFDEDD